MTFPTTPTLAAGRVAVLNQANTTPTRTFPAFSLLTGMANGDLLIAIVVGYRSSTTNAQFSGWTNGFTEFHDSGTSTTEAIGVAYKWTTGSETGSLAVTQATTVTGYASMILLAIPGAHATTPPEAGGRADGTTAAANPVSFDPAGWAAEDTLWIAVGGSGETALTSTYVGFSGTAPTNYTDYAATALVDDVIGRTQAAVAFRQLNASAEDVGVWAVDLSAASNSAALIAVRPAAVQPSSGAAVPLTATLTAAGSVSTAGLTITSFETTNWTSTTTPLTITITGAVTGDLIVVPFGGDNGVVGSPVTASSVSTTGGSTSAWTELEEHLAAGFQAWVNLAYADVTADGTVTISLARTQGTGSMWGGWAALCHNHGGVGVHGNSAPSATETLSLTVEQDSAVLILAIDWDDLAIVAFTPAGATDVERAQNANLTNYAGYWTAQAAGTRGYGIATSSTTNLHINAVEVKAAGGAPAIPPIIVMAPRRP